MKIMVLFIWWLDTLMLQQFWAKAIVVTLELKCKHIYIDRCGCIALFTRMWRDSDWRISTRRQWGEESSSGGLSRTRRRANVTSPWRGMANPSRCREPYIQRYKVWAHYVNMYFQYFKGILRDGYVWASLTDWGRYLQVVTQFNPDISSPFQSGGGGHDGEDPGLDRGQGGGAGQTRAPGGGPGESGDRSGE